MSASDSRPRRQLATSPFNKPPAEPVVPDVFEVADKVCHDKYGLGTVVSLDGTHGVVVNFGSETRRITLPSTKLSPL
ncbi:MAG: hypothetical protein ACT4QF_21850 [Sporichthyaceae bacterium]|jgi:hypothetical protein